jgi:predicted TIM-barrel fold metal-dependent hydrolase
LSIGVATNVIPGVEERGNRRRYLAASLLEHSASFGDPVRRMLRDIVGFDQVLFGSDHPYLRRDLAVDCVQKLEQTCVISDVERAEVMSGNAVKLFPRFAL